jgi:hypothetical protein
MISVLSEVISIQEFQMAKKSTGKTTSKRKPAKAKGTLGARKGAKKPVKPKAKTKAAKKISKPTSKRSPATKKSIARTKATAKKRVLKSSSARPEVTSKKAVPSKRTIVAKPRTKAVRPNADMTPASAVERVGGAMPPKNPHPGMMGDGTEEQNLNQAGMPEARITHEDVEIAFKRTEPDRR